MYTKADDRPLSLAFIYEAKTSIGRRRRRRTFPPCGSVRVQEYGLVPVSALLQNVQIGYGTAVCAAYQPIRLNRVKRLNSKPVTNTEVKTMMAVT